MNRFNRAVRVTATLIILLTGGGLAIPSVRADTSATVSVTASVGIVPSLSVSVCDDTANFGSGLTNEGAAPAGADPGVFATEPGTESGQGVFYVWSAQCSPGIRVEGNVDLFLLWCATENGGANASPDVSVGQQDLRFALTSWGTYSQWLTNTSPLACPNNYGFFFDPPSLPSDLGLSLGLRIDEGDANGDFSSVVTFSVQAA